MVAGRLCFSPFFWGQEGGEPLMMIIVHGNLDVGPTPIHENYRNEEWLQGDGIVGVRVKGLKFGVSLQG